MRTETSVVTPEVIKRKVVIELEGQEEIETFTHLLGCLKNQDGCFAKDKTRAMAERLYEELGCKRWWRCTP